MFNRVLAKNLPRTSFFLFGPRQVGKSTLLKELEAKLYIDLLDPDEQLSFCKNPKLLSERLDALDQEGIVIIDEVQKVPKLLDVIHYYLEARPKFTFIMSGSSARKLRHGAANLLGGRAAFRTLHPLTMQEMGKTFNLKQALAYGTLPRIWTLLTAGEKDLVQDLLHSYIITYLQEEIKAEALVRNLQGFQNFLDVVAAQFAEQVNFSGIGRDCQVAYSTVCEYYSILEDTLLGFFLRPYTKSVRKRMSHQPRFYFFDNGVTRAILGNLKDEPSPLEIGRLFEQWFVQEVYRLNEYNQKNWKLFFWRTSHGAEVDLVIEYSGKIICAIECKYKKNITRSDLSGIKAFLQTNKNIPVYVVAPVTQKQKIDETEVLQPKELLNILKEK